MIFVGLAYRQNDLLGQNWTR